jgi:hypothetical protein
MAGRKPNPLVVPAEDNFSPDAAQALSGKAAEQAARSTEIAERFGDGTPYERNRVVGEARFYMGQSAEAMLELGKRLIQLKENEPHGEFTEIVTERLGINLRSGQKMMQAAAKFLSPSIASKASSVTLLGRGKLFDLMSEDDEDIEELADGGTLAGKTLDEMQAMTRRELQAALQEERKKNAAKDKVIQAKSTKLDRLEEELALRDAAPLDEVEDMQLTDLRTRTLGAEAALQQLLVLVDDVTTNPATQATEVAARHSLDYLVQRIVDGCLARGITVDMAERVSPIWAAPIEDAAKGGGRKGRK